MRDYFRLKMVCPDGTGILHFITEADADAYVRERFEDDELRAEYENRFGSAPEEDICEGREDDRLLGFLRVFSFLGFAVSRVSLDLEPASAYVWNDAEGIWVIPKVIRGGCAHA